MLVDMRRIVKPLALSGSLSELLELFERVAAGAAVAGSPAQGRAERVFQNRIGRVAVRASPRSQQNEARRGILGPLGR